MRKYLLALMLCFPALAEAAPWILDTADSTIRVQVGYRGGKGVTVNFRSFGGKIDFDQRRPQTAKALIRINADDLETGLGLINRMVRSPDYLSTRAYPEIIFQLDNLTQTSKQTATITGRITLRGVTRKMTFQARVFRYGPSEANPDIFEAGFNLEGSIDRRDFGSTAGVPDVAPVLPVKIRLVMTSQPS